MAETNNEYSYTITASYVNNKEEVPIASELIGMCYIDYSYETLNSPVFVMKIKLPSELYNKMQDNKSTAKMVIGIGKKPSSSTTSVRYIYKQFSYHFPTLKYSDVQVSLDGSEKETDDKNAYITCAIGLIDDSIVNANKMIINNKFNNTNNISIIHHYTEGMRMIIEPFDYMDNMKTCIIPPMEGITDLIYYMNNMSTFYNNASYRFFMDYNYTYLLSNKGNPIDIRDGTFTTINITVDKYNEKKGVQSDFNQKVYTLQVKEGQMSYNNDDLTEKIYNRLYGVSNKGEVTSIDLDIQKGHDSKNRYKMIRIPNNNIHYLEDLKNDVEESGFPVEIMISNVDNSLFVPYKQYVLTFFRERRSYNGVYILVDKQEAYVAKGEGEFYSSIILKFKKKY